MRRRPRLAQALPSTDIAWQIYAGAGRAVPADFFGMHFLQYPIPQPFTCTFDSGGDLVNVNHINLGNDNWRKAKFTTTSALPSPLVVGTEYWNLPVDSTHTQLSASRGGSAIGIDAGGSGTHTIHFTTPPPEFSFGHVRLWDSQTQWSRVNPSAGVYVWTFLDQFLDTHYPAGRPLIYCMGSTPTHASSNPTGGAAYGAAGDRYPPVDIEDPNGPLITFVTALITHCNKAGGYAGTDATRITHFEIWNEPWFLGNDSGFYAGTASELARMGKVIYETVKAIDPNIIVLSPSFSDGAIFQDTTTGMAALYLNASDGAAGTGADWMDAFAFHAYDKDYPNIADLVDVDTWVTDLLTAAGVASPSIFPRYNHEWGYNVDQAAFIALTDTERANHLRASMLVQAALGWKHTTPYKYGAVSGTGVNYLGGVVLKPLLDAAFNDVFWLGGKTLTNVAQLTNGSLQFFANGVLTTWAGP